ncbi:MFS transporter [Pseudomonas sp. S75]|uniref:MFS transporter n=1 Tax=unclassified Pseudomonas TaxID=196821 RepID=UPI001903EE8B|nr:MULTISPECIES: MFS transporter [unclassified Pseudomonas]MBJ9977994.1 MFS transporter [Pseudomonas sp. S30]MBK0155716.1 MFS transporter [Pseudomonas sp. S75]
MSSPGRRLLVLLALMTLLGVFPVDVVLPSLQALSQEFSVSLASASYSVSLFAIGVAVSQCAIGPLSDRIGRKRLLQAGLYAAIIGALGCALSDNYASFTAFRLLQALGCGCFALSQAIIQDRYTGSRRNTLRIILITASGLFISTAPLAGSVLQNLLGWQGSFYVFSAFACLAIVLCARELENTRPTAPVPGAMKSYGLLVRDLRFLAYSLFSAFAFACHFSFIVVSPLLLMDHLGLSKYGFSMVFLGYGCAYLGGGILASAISRRAPAHSQIRIGLGLIGVAGGLLVVWLTVTTLSIMALLVPMVICTAGTTILRPAATCAAMGRHPDRAGAAAALSNTLVFAIGGLASGLIALMETRLPMSLGFGFIGVSLCGAWVLKAVSQPASEAVA